MKNIKKIVVFIICVFLLSGCSFFETDVMEDVEIYTTTYPVNYLINYLYGPHSTIHSIYPNGVEFKEYELSDKKIAEYAKSDLFVFNSQDIERDYAVKMLNVNNNLKLIDTSYGMDYDYSIEELWLNPYNYLMMAKNISDSMSEYITNPYLVDEIKDNYQNLQYDLSKLDATYQETLSNAKYKTIVADNSLFKYLEKYNIEVIVLEEEIVPLVIKEGDKISDIAIKYGISVSEILTYNDKKNENLTVGETIKLPIKLIESTDISKVKKLITDGKISYIYSCNFESNDVVKQLIEENTLELITFNTMYSIDGGVTNTNETYLTIMSDNLELLKKELNK